jgi:hypothetical protein
MTELDVTTRYQEAIAKARAPWRSREALRAFASSRSVSHHASRIRQSLRTAVRPVRTFLVALVFVFAGCGGSGHSTGPTPTGFCTPSGSVCVSQFTVTEDSHSGTVNQETATAIQTGGGVAEVGGSAEGGGGDFGGGAGLGLRPRGSLSLPEVNLPHSTTVGNSTLTFVSASAQGGQIRFTYTVTNPPTPPIHISFFAIDQQGQRTAPQPAVAASGTAGAPVPPPTTPPPPFMVTAIAQGPFPPGSSGCVTIHADSPPGDTACGSNVNIAGDEGTRGTVTAVPAGGFRFLRWASFSSDCQGETTNPCSFAFDRSKTMFAIFGR